MTNPLAPPDRTPPAVPVQVDHSCRSVRLGVATLAVAAVLRTRPAGVVPPSAAPHVRALADAGLTESASGAITPRLVPWFAELVAAVATADDPVVVQTFVGARVAERSLWPARRVSALAHHHTDGSILLEPVHTDDVASALAGLVGLDPHRAGPAEARSTVSTERLDRIHHHLLAGDLPELARSLDPPDAPGAPELQLLSDLVDGRAHTWRASVGGICLLVIDGGDRGLWMRRSTLIQPRPDLEPTTAASAFAALADLAARDGDPRADAAEPASPQPLPSDVRNPCPTPPPPPPRSTPTGSPTAQDDCASAA